MLDRFARLTKMRRPAGVTIVLFALFAFAPVGGAVADTIAGGTTSLRLNGTLFDRLHDNGVQVLGLKPGRVQGRSATLPIAEGQIDGVGRGSMRHEGGIKFKAGKRAVTLKKVFLNTTKQALSATIGKRSLKIASTLPHGTAWDGFDLDISVRELPLTGRAASLLNRKLGLDGVFKGGRSLGAIANDTRLDWVTVGGGTITVVLDEGFAGKLKSLDITTSPFGPTKVVGSQPQTYELEIRHGQLKPDLSGAGLLSESGLWLTQNEGEAGFPKMLMASMGIDLESKKFGSDFIVYGPQGLESSGAFRALLDFQPAAAQVDLEAGAVSMPAMRATLESSVATALNETFAKGKDPVFSTGETVGTVAFTLRTR